jgi:hypothetical protein
MTSGVLLALSLVLSLAAQASADGRAYLGLSVRDVPGVGCVVTGVGPGPLGGTGLEGTRLRRPDLLVAIDGKPASREALRAALAARSAGESVRLSVRPAARADWRIPNRTGEMEFANEAIELEVTLDAAERWRGSVENVRDDSPPRPAPPAGLFERHATAAIGGLERTAELEKTVAAVSSGSRSQRDAGGLPAVATTLDHPTSLPEVGIELTGPLAAGDASRPFATARDTLGRALGLELPPHEGHGSMPVPTASHGLFALDFLLNGPRPAIEEALGPRRDDDALLTDARDSLRRMMGGQVFAEPRVAERLASIRSGGELDLVPLVAALGQFDVELAIGFDPATAEAEPLPDALAGAVDGPILAASEIPGLGWAVVGGPGDNRYDLAKVAAVLEMGGNDEYRISQVTPGTRGIVDLAGNDRYVGHPEQGLGCAIGGVFVIDDRGGDDRHEGRFGVGGCGVLGVGAVVDRGGNDVYLGETWSHGAGAWGGGILLDLGGDDRFDAAEFSQGIGGPRGAGVLCDLSGADLYRMDGPSPSVYGVPATFSSFGQGCGIGLRNAAFGGVGLLVDAAGDDRYEAGEFSQGIGYYHGLGVLHDRGGHDRYAGDRYSQGSAAHQAAGLLLDDAGDDSYVARTAANQGGAWDQSVAWLVDRAGSDSYQADGLAQGGAAQQALAVLLDLGGRDRRIAHGGSILGESGDDSYHFLEPPPVGGAYSFSLHVDLGGEPDAYPPVRGDGIARTTGSPAEPPENASFHGVFVDDGPKPEAPRP